MRRRSLRRAGQRIRTAGAGQGRDGARAAVITIPDARTVSPAARIAHTQGRVDDVARGCRRALGRRAGQPAIGRGAAAADELAVPRPAVRRVAHHVDEDEVGPLDVVDRRGTLPPSDPTGSSSRAHSMAFSNKRAAPIPIRTEPAKTQDPATTGTGRILTSTATRGKRI